MHHLTRLTRSLTHSLGHARTHSLTHSTSGDNALNKIIGTKKFFVVPVDSGPGMLIMPAEDIWSTVVTLVADFDAYKTQIEVEFHLVVYYGSQSTRSLLEYKTEVKWSRVSLEWSAHVTHCGYVQKLCLHYAALCIMHYAALCSSDERRAPTIRVVENNKVTRRIKLREEKRNDFEGVWRSPAL